MDRVLSRIKVHPLGCWEFLGALDKGYGIVNVGPGDKTDRTHRVVYRDFVGPIPDDQTLDHLCFNPRCCNPAHLEVVSRSENTRRQWAAGRTNVGAARRARTTCIHGHPFDEENTYHWGGDGARRCRTCANEASRRHRARLDERR